MTHHFWTVNQNGFRFQGCHDYHKPQPQKKQLMSPVLLTMASVVAFAQPSVANIVPNGLNTAVDTQDCPPGCTVTEGSIKGTNLFHSFEEFSVPANGTMTGAPGLMVITIPNL